MKELLSIAKKYKIKGVFIGTRKQSQKFTDEDVSLLATLSSFPRSRVAFPLK